MSDDRDLDMSDLGSADDLKASSGKRRFAVSPVLPVCGKRFRIRSLTTSELEAYNTAVLTEDGTKLRKDRMSNATRRLIVLALVDREGNRLFTEKQIPELSQIDAIDAQALYDFAAKHCGVNRSELESLLKNSSETAAEEKS
jgi:hypothetical protein